MGQRNATDQHDRCRSAPEPVARRFFTLLVFSVALNALLASALIKGGMRSPPKAEPVNTTAVEETRSLAPRAILAPSTGALPTARVLKAKWDSLYSDDPREYAGRLRLAGCPEGTVRVIIRAQLYQDRERRLAAVRPAPLFGTPAEKMAADIRMFNEPLAIVWQFDALAFEIAGIRVLDEPNHSIQDFVRAQALLQFITSIRPSETWDDLFALLDRCEHLDDDLRSLPPLARARESAVLADWFRATLGKIIGPVEQHEFAERLTGFFAFEATETDGFKFTGPEIQTLAKWLVNEVPELQVPGAAILLDHSPDDMADTHRAEFEEALEKSLSPERLLEWRVDQDEDCRRITAALNKEVSAPQKAREFYLIKQEAERALLNLLGQRYSGEEQLQKVIQLTRHYAQRVRTFLPEAAWKALDKPRPCWMDVPGESQ